MYNFKTTIVCFLNICEKWKEKTLLLVGSDPVIFISAKYFCQLDQVHQEIDLTA